MGRSLFSPLWYRVAAQRPRLHLDVRVERQRHRDQLWYLLVDGTSGRHFRINDKAYQFVGRCDGACTVQEIWDHLLAVLTDEAPTQDEVIALLGRLDEQGLIITEAVPDAQALVQRDVRAKRRRRRAFVNPFAFRVSLGDPWPLLKRMGPLSIAVFHRATLWLWLAMVIAACITAAVNWDALRSHADIHLGTGRFLLLTWLSFPVIKALHEFCHGLAVRRWGGEVHEMGLTLFVLVPAPYVDASASTSFRARYQRVVVCAAGLMCELFIAAIALFVWLSVQPGLVRDLAFVSMVIASVSTLLFNGNPLLKFDAYYVLCDLLDLPNLAARSRRWWSERAQRLVTPSPRAPAPLAAGEGKWLVLYAPLSAVYRVFIFVIIVLWVGAQSALLGAVAAAFVLYTGLLKPACAAGRRLLDSAGPGSARWRARGALATATVMILGLVFLLPLPLRTAAPGVVWLPEQARVRAETDGFVSQVLARDGDAVRAGTVILRIDDPVLFATRDHLVGRRAELEAEGFNALLQRDLTRKQHIDEEIAKTDGELQHVAERIAHLEVRSGTDGTLVMPRQQDMPGAFAPRGANLGLVLNRQDVVVRTAVREEDAALVRDRTVRVAVRIAGAAHEEIVGELVNDVPAATRQLPSAALGERGGGPYAIDPADQEGVNTLDPVVLIDLRLPARVLERVGSRVWVRFEHGAEPLGGQLYRRARQLFLRHFNPAGT